MVPGGVLLAVLVPAQNWIERCADDATDRDGSHRPTVPVHLVGGARTGGKWRRRDCPDLGHVHAFVPRRSGPA